MSEVREETIAVSSEILTQLEASYSADRVSEGASIRKPVQFENRLYVAVGINNSRVDAYALVPREEFTGTVRTYRVPPGREYEEYYESLRNDPKGFYHGMLVKHKGKEWVLLGPEVTFVSKSDSQGKITTTAPQPRSQLDLLGSCFELLPNGLIVHGKPSEEEYEEAFRRLSLIESAQSWWWGDLANARERDYGSLKEIAEKYGKDYNSLHVCQYVSSRYENVNRFTTLGFRHHMIAAPLEDRLEWLKRAEQNNWTAAELTKQIRLSKLLPPSWDSAPPIITVADYRTWLPEQPDCDLLLTDPPYSTEIQDVRSFAQDWLPLALAKVKPTGRAYIFVGAYPEELEAYLSINPGNMTLANIMVWEYQNTIGPASKLDYNLNWQAILYYRGPEAPELNCPVLTEQFAVQEVNAPDGRTGIRYSEWQKPDELAERLIRHSTSPGHLVLDCFAGTGTFLLAAAKFKRIARGCDISQEMVDIAASRGCQVVKLQ